MYSLSYVYSPASRIYDECRKPKDAVFLRTSLPNEGTKKECPTNTTRRVRTGYDELTMRIRGCSPNSRRCLVGCSVPTVLWMCLSTKDFLFNVWWDFHFSLRDEREGVYSLQGVRGCLPSKN